MKSKNAQCPFEIGQNVVYRPSARGLALNVMASSSQKLVSGKICAIKEIQNGAYVVVEGYDHPGGGINWTEFRRAE